MGRAAVVEIDHLRHALAATTHVPGGSQLAGRAWRLSKRCALDLDARRDAERDDCVSDCAADIAGRAIAAGEKDQLDTRRCERGDGGTGIGCRRLCPVDCRSHDERWLAPCEEHAGLAHVATRANDRQVEWKLSERERGAFVRVGDSAQRPCLLDESVGTLQSHAAAEARDGIDHKTDHASVRWAARRSAAVSIISSPSSRVAVVGLP